MTSSEIRNRLEERIDHSFHAGSRPGALVVLGHGVTGNKDRPLLVAVAKGLSARGWPCLRISYTGNGESEGFFEESTISKEIGDLSAVLSFVPDYAAVAYVGHSMGGAVGVLSAARDPRIRVLVSLAGMTHTAAFYEREFGELEPGKDCMWEEPACPLSVAYRDDLKSIGDTLGAAAAVSQAWLLIHGAEDDVVPPVDGKDAFAAATSEKRWVEIEGAGHSFDEASYSRIIDEIEAWLQKHLS